MDTLVVMKEETVATSINDFESYDPSTFIVEEYSEEVGSHRGVASTDELNIAQEVYIGQDHTVTYEVRNIEEVPLFNYSESHDNLETVVEDGELSLENVEEAIVYEERQFYSKIDNRVAKAALKKRRGRPPKFQISEIGQDGRKWYSCSVCDQKHEDRMELMQHMRQHNADRPFHCKECGKAFKQAAHLKVHVRQHTGEKPFECGICGKGFRQKAIVDQHMRTHTQLRPYACTYLNCDKSFAQKTSLDNHTKSHQTGRLSEAFKKQQEEQKKKSLIAQEALKNKNLKPKLVQVLPNGKKRPVHRVLGGALSVGKEKIKTTVVKMTQSQFEDYLHSRAGNAPPESPQISQKELTSKQKAATGPFLAYVNLCKPLLQAERPELSLLEVLKELASRWNSMNKPEKQKFAVIAKESEDKQEYNATTFVASEEFGSIIKSDVDLLDDGDGDVVNSMEGAVFEVGESSSGDFYQVDKQLPEETFFEIDQASEKSLNQNVFGKKVLLLNKPSENFEYEEQQFNDQNFSVTSNVFQSEDANMQVVEGFDDTEQILEQTAYTPDGTVVQFEGEDAGDSLEQGVLQFGESTSNGTVVFDNGSDGTVVYGNGSEMEIGNSTIFFLPNIVGEEQLEQVM